MFNDEEVQRRLHILTLDNLGVAKRPMYDRIVKSVIPKLKIVYRQTRLPPELDALERKNILRVLWPRSRYAYSTLYNKSEAYRHIIDEPYSMDLTQEYSHPFRSSNRWQFDRELERNKRALSKGAGLPNFGKKRDELANAIEYIENVVYPEPKLDSLFSIMPGFRTQQSNPAEVPALRLIHQIAVSTWYIQCQAYDDGITNTIQANQGEDNDVKLFYCTNKELHKWYQNHDAEVIDWVNLDATQYDSTVCRSENSASVRLLAGDFEFIDLLDAHSNRTDIVMPEGVMQRDGGKSSGDKDTNWTDGYTNCRDNDECLSKSGVFNRLQGRIVNGDDISIGLKTKVTKQLLDKFAKYTRRNLNVDKCTYGASAYNSKWYMDINICTRSMWRVVNSTLFMEHESDPITGSKAYIAVSLAQQMLDLEQHPLSDQIYKAYLSIDKYPLRSFESEEQKAAAEAYVGRHNYQADWQSSESLLSRLLDSPFVRMG